MSTPDSTQTATSLYNLMETVLSQPNLETTEKIKLINELRKNNPKTSDRWAYRWAIWMLGVAVLITIGCITLLSLNRYQIPDGLIAIGSSVAGGLAGLLSQNQN